MEKHKMICYHSKWQSGCRREENRGNTIMRRKNTAALMAALIIGSMFAGCGSAGNNVNKNNSDYIKETQAATRAVADGETKSADNTVKKADKETETLTQEVISEDANQTDSVNDDNTEVSDLQAGGDNDNSWQESWDGSDSGDDYQNSGEDTWSDEDSSGNGGEDAPVESGDVNIIDDNRLLSSAKVNTVTYSEFANEVLRLVNIERAKEGVAPLILDEALCNAGNMRAIEMDCSGYFSHVRPNGHSCFEVYDICNVEWENTCGENIAAGQITPKEVMTSWLGSSGHKANIISPEYTRMGLGYSTGGGGEYGHYWAQEFAG